MKNLERNGIVKKVISILLILAMVLPYFPMSVFAEGETGENEKVKFSANWSGKTEGELEEGTTNDSFDFNFSVTFNRVQTGFQNVTIEMKTDDVAGAYDTITLDKSKISGVNANTVQGSGYALLSIGNVDSGVSISGQASVNFKNMNAELERKLILVVKGEYKDPATGETCKIEETIDGSRKELKARVRPAAQLTAYKASLEYSKEKDSEGKEKILQPTLNVANRNPLNGEAIFGTENLVVGWYTTGARATYPVHVYSAEKTQKLELKVTINRCTNDKNVDTINRMSEGYTINWDGLDSDLGEPVETTNDDGSVTYTFTKGTDSNVYNSETAFAINKDYNISILYNTPNTNPKTVSDPEFKTHVTFNAELNTIGFKLSKEFDGEEQGEKITVTDGLSDSRTIELYSYTPGQDAWIKVIKNSSNIGNDQYKSIYIDDNVRTQLKETKKADVNFSVSTVLGAKGQKPVVTGNIDFSQPKLYYLADNGNHRTITLTADQMKLKSIDESVNLYDTYFVNGASETEFDQTFTPTVSVNKFSIKLDDFLKNAGNDSFYLKYELDVNAIGLSDTEIDNIEYISTGYTVSDSNLIQGYDTLSVKKAVQRVTNDFSYMQLELGGNFNATSNDTNITQEKTLKLKMYKNPSVFIDTDNVKNYVVNKNPVFFVSLPGSYTEEIAYDIDPDNITLSSRSLTIEDLDLITANGEDYLVISCLGTYDSRTMGEIDVNIKYDRTVLDSTSRNYQIKAYMLTDNENYYSSVSNSNNFGENTPDEIFLATGSFNVSGISQIESITSVQRKMNGNLEGNLYRPNSKNGQDNDDTELGKPLIIKQNDQVVYESSIASYAETIKDITMLSRLPLSNNLYIDEENPMIASGYELPDSFYDEFGGKLNGTTQGSPVSQIDLTNLNILGVYKKDSGNRETQLDSSKYTIYVSTDANATFDSTSFVQYNVGDDVSQVKNIKVVVDSSVTVKDRESIILKYEMTMPNDGGMVGAQTAGKYTATSTGAANTLYSPAAYVINGDTTADVKVQKTFENYAKGVAPTEYGVNSLANIKFKLQYFDEDTNSKKFLQNSNNEDIVATTDENGVAVFGSIPAGRYYLYEVTEFENYSGIDLVYFNVKPSETKNVTAKNKLKKGNIVINKQWEGETNNEANRKATFLVSRINRDNEEFEFTPRTVTTFNNRAIAESLPYGDYAVTETNSESGWVAEEVNKTVTVNDEEVTVPDGFKNIPGKGILEITKTVPTGESVEGLSFHITGRGMIEKPETLSFNINTDMTIKIGEEYPSNVDVEVSENNTKAVITISDLYLGYYNVEEIEIPTITNTDIEKYNEVSRSVQIIQHDLENPVRINIANSYKYGRIQIIKTAKLKEGDNYTDIGDLSKFRIHITGKSYYNHDVDEYIMLDEDGFGSQRLEIGKYTVTEVPVDGYTTYYGTNSEASTEPVEITVESNRTYTQNIYNEHTGVGYLRVEKSLEGVSDPQKVIDAGIQFKVVGQNVAGTKIGPDGKGVIININQIDTTKNVAYGVSEAISAGGEYELQEVESTVPEYFEAIEPREIQIKSAKTVTEVAENTRAKGNLEMVTTTNPEGGPLKGITYEVTPVSINADGTYVTTGEAQVVAGSNDDINPSFAKLENINSGFYLVAQKTVPDGWAKDVNQIVEVPRYNTGYANFEIIEKDKVKNNKLTINKVLLNQNGEVASNEDIEKAKLNLNEQFEIRIRNINTNQVYYVFTSVAKPGVIQGLDAGTYSIEEVFKPKYMVEGYYLVNEVVSSTNGSGQTITNEVEIGETAGSGYLFTIQDNNGVSRDLNLTVKNTINTNYGFGGQDGINNLSKNSVEEQSIQTVTKAVIYVVDENNNAVPGVKFTLVNSRGETVVVNDLGTEYEIPDKKLVIRGLEPGVYTLKCVEYPQDKYLKPDDKQIVVYSDASQVGRVEIQKNIPRGSITLATTYQTKSGETRYTSRSKYKVVDSETGELVKFVRTATGDYKKSNLEDASPIIVLKSGPVEIEGIETGNYEVGIVDVTKGYGIIKTEPEFVTIEENTNKDIVVEVANKNINSIGSGPNSTWYLDDNNDLYYVGALGAYYNTGKSERRFVKYEFPSADVKIEKFDHNGYQDGVAIDKDGKVWSFNTSLTAKCLTDQGNLNYAYRNNVKFVDAKFYQGYGAGLLDNNGRVWFYDSHMGDYKVIYENEENPATKLAKPRSGNYSNGIGFIDSVGKVWMFGNSLTEIGCGLEDILDDNPICISDYTDLKDIKVEDLIMCYGFAVALDSNGNVWIWGKNSNKADLIVGDSNTNTKPTKLNSSLFEGARIKKIAASGYYAELGLVDEYGKVWMWGYGEHGELGNGSTSNSNTPICISDDETENLFNIEIKDLEISSSADNYNSNNHVVALDSENRIWSWGGKSYCGESGSYSDNYITEPQLVPGIYNAHLEYNLKFSKVFSGHDGNGGSKFAVDEEGRLWTWGKSIFNSSQTIVTPTVVAIPGEPKVKKVVTREGGQTLILSEDGRVYICGLYVAEGNGKTYNDYYGTAITEITDNFNLSGENIITDVYLGYSSYSDQTFYAIDSEGKLYTWGYSSYSRNLGRTDTESATVIECISDDITEPLNGIKIKKIGKAYEGMRALSENGDVYDIPSTGVPSLVVEGRNIVDIVGCFLLDSDGKILSLDSSNTLRDKSEMTDYTLYQKYKNNSTYKITDLYNADYGYVIYKDSEGNYWKDISATGTSLAQITVPATGVKDLAYDLVVDQNGQLWLNNVNMAVANRNSLYNIKMKHIDPDKNDNISYFEDTEGNLYNTGTINGISYAKIEDKSKVSLKYYLEKTLGLTIISGPDNAKNVAIDQNGKVWAWNGGNIICLSDQTGTALAEKYSSDSNFKMLRVYSESKCYYAVDNSGKVWSWSDQTGVNTTAVLGNGTTTNNKNTPICISDQYGVDINNITSVQGIHGTQMGNYPTPEGIIAKDDNGNVWIWGGYNSSNGGLSGNGSRSLTLKPFHVNTQISGKSILDICVSQGANGIILCTDGSIYENRGNYTSYRWRYVGKCEGATKVYYDYNSNQTGDKEDVRYIVGNNKLWAYGYSKDNQKVTQPQLISTEFTMDKVLPYTNWTNSNLNWVNQYIYRITDTEGNIWNWGQISEDEFIYPRKVENESKVVAYLYHFVRYNNYANAINDYYECFPITSDGILKYYKDKDEDKNISQFIKDVYGELNNENIQDFADKYNKKSDAKIYFIANGKLCKITTESNSSSTMFLLQNLSDMTGSEISGKQIVEILGRRDVFGSFVYLNQPSSCSFALDSEGNLYDNIDDCPRCITTKEFLNGNPINYRNAIVNQPEGSALYGIKFKELYNDRFAKDENDNIWYFPQSGEPVNISKEEYGTRNAMYLKDGVKHIYDTSYFLTNNNEVWYDTTAEQRLVAKYEDNYEIVMEGYSNSTNNEYFVALNKSNGELIAKGVNSEGLLGVNDDTTNGELVKLSSIEETELYNAKQANPNLKIVKAYEYTPQNAYTNVIAIDNEGKVWAWGKDMNGEIGDGTTYSSRTEYIKSPKCITNILNTDLNSAFNNGVKIVDFQDGKLIDNNGDTWIVDTTSKYWKYVKDTVDVSGVEGIGTVEEVVSPSTETYKSKLVVDNNKNLYSYNILDDKFEKVDDLSGVNSVRYLNTTSKNETIGGVSYNNYVDNYLVETSNGIYVVAVKYNLSLTDSCLTYQLEKDTLLDNKEITDIQYANNVYSFVDEDGKVYCYAVTDTASIFATTTLKEFTDFDEAIEKIYGEVTTQNKLDIIANSYESDSVCYVANNSGDAYSIQKNEDEITVALMNVSRESIDGVGTIVNVIGEYEFAAKDGRKYKVTPTGVSEYEIAETDTATPYQTAEPDSSVQLEGVTVVKQTQHKALDNKGNLYVWGEYTGLEEETTEPFNMTEDYVVEPVYYNGSGWTVIQKQY